MGRQYLRFHLFPLCNTLTGIQTVLMEAVRHSVRAAAVHAEVPVEALVVVVVVGEIRC